MSAPSLIVNVIDETAGTACHETWGATGCVIDHGLARHPDVTEYTSSPPRYEASRWIVHLPAGDVAGLVPPMGPFARDLEVFDPAQRVEAIVSVPDGPYGPMCLRFVVDGPALTGELIDPELDTLLDGIDLRFELPFAALLRWIHLEQPLGPSLWLSGQIFGLDVFALSLLDGVMSAPATDPPIGPLALPDAVEVACRLAELRAGALLDARSISSAVDSGHRR